MASLEDAQPDSKPPVDATASEQHGAQNRPSMLEVLQGGSFFTRGNASSQVSRAISCLTWRQRYIHAPEYPLKVRSVTMPLRQLKQGELRGLGTGATVWAAAHVLCKYLERRYSSEGRPLASCMSGLRVIDLGAGTGAVGLAAGLMGASVTLTDQEQLTFLMHENLDRVRIASKQSDLGVASSSGIGNDIDSGATLDVHVTTYDWGGDDAHLAPLPFDVVLVSDCILPKLYPIEPLVAALCALTEPRSSSVRESEEFVSAPVIIMSYEHRTWKDFDPRDRFDELAAAAGLCKRVVPHAEHDHVYQADDIEIWELYRASNNTVPSSLSDDSDASTHKEPSHVSSSKVQTIHEEGGVATTMIEVVLVNGRETGKESERERLKQTLTVRLSRGEHGTVAGDLWASSVAMAEHLITIFNPSLPPSTRQVLLELGSGLGLVAKVASQELGFQKVVATDKASVLPTLRKNLLVDAIAEAGDDSCKVQVEEYDWSEQAPDSVLHAGPFSVVVCADCIYDSATVAPLLSALRCVCNDAPISPRIFLANELRTALDAFLRAAPASNFTVKHLGIVEREGIHGRRPVGLYELSDGSSQSPPTQQPPPSSSSSSSSPSPP